MNGAASPSARQSRRSFGRNRMAEVPCDKCGLRIEVAITPAQSTPTAVAQRNIGPVTIDAFLARCLFIRESGRRISGPSDCPYFQSTIDAAIAAGRL